MRNDILLIHKVLTKQADKKDLEQFLTQYNESGRFVEMFDEISQLSGLSPNKLPFKPNMNHAYDKFLHLTDNTESNIYKTHLNTITKKSKVELLDVTTSKFSLLYIIKIAAIFLFVLGSYFLFNFDRSSFEYITEGNIATHKLMDKSVITLNHNSALIGANDFNKESRTISLLDGEVFFDIAKDKEKPFIINIDKIKVLVTGTSFDISTDENVTVINVLEGEVHVMRDNQEFVLVENDKLKYDKTSGLFTKSFVSTSNVFSWIDKELTFEGTSLDIVFDDIARFYDIKIEYPSNVNNCNFTSPVFKDYTLKKVLKTISLTYDFTYLMSEDKVVIEEVNCINN